MSTHPDSTSLARTSRFPISTITVDDGIQQRAHGVVQDLVAEYAEDIVDWIDVAPVVVYWDGETRWLVDGFHRIAAAVRAELVDVPATVYEGTRRDAIRYAARANQQHGLRRTSADKRRAVETLLADPEWSEWSDRRIAAMAGVSPTTVGTIRAQVSKLDTCEPDQPADQAATVATCEPPAEPEVVIEELPGADMEGVRETVSHLSDTTPQQPKPEKRIGRDGKAYAAPKPKPSEDHNKPRIAMRAAHAVTAALNGLVQVEADLLESDARTLMANLSKALDRLAARFPVATTEGADNA